MMRYFFFFDRIGCLSLTFSIALLALCIVVFCAASLPIAMSAFTIQPLAIES